MVSCSEANGLDRRTTLHYIGMQCNAYSGVTKMGQLTVRLDKELEEGLRKESEATGLKRSDIARLALRQWLAYRVALPSGRPIDRVRHLIGSLDSGIPDLAERRSEYLKEGARRAAEKAAKSKRNVQLGGDHEPA